MVVQVLFNTPTRALMAHGETAGEGDGASEAGPAVMHEELSPALVMQEGEMVYDYCWYVWPFHSLTTTCAYMCLCVCVCVWVGECTSVRMLVRVFLSS